MTVSNGGDWLDDWIQVNLALFGPQARVLGVNMQPAADWVVFVPPLISLATGWARAPLALRACMELS